MVELAKPFSRWRAGLLRQPCPPYKKIPRLLAAGSFIPGVMTPSEIEQGLALGCKLLKFFPAGAASAVNMLKNLGGPYASQGVQFCPTGGLSLDNMNDYLALPIVSAIGGSWLATKQQIADRQWDVITDQVKAALAKATAL